MQGIIEGETVAVVGLADGDPAAYRGDRIGVEQDEVAAVEPGSRRLGVDHRCEGLERLAVPAGQDLAGARSTSASWSASPRSFERAINASTAAGSISALKRSMPDWNRSRAWRPSMNAR